MRTMTMGEYYVWYCEWCDSRNLTPWTKATSGKVSCGCCHKEYPVTGARRSEGAFESYNQMIEKHGSFSDEMGLL